MHTPHQLTIYRCNMAAPPYTFFHYGTPATIVQAQPHNVRTETASS